MAFSSAHTRERRNRPLEEVLAEKRGRAVNLPTKFRLKGITLYALIGGAILALLALANGYQESLVCKDMRIQITADQDNAFLLPVDIKQNIVEAYGSTVIGDKMNSIELLQLEDILQKSPFVQKAEVYKNLTGVLFVDVAIRRPIARIMNENGSSMYVDEFGYKFPPTPQHVANVPLIRGAFTEAFVPEDSLSCAVEEAMPVIKYVDQNPFWKAQISEIRIKENGDILLYPEVGKLYMEFGVATRIAEKFDNLKLFYEQVANEIGWNTYKGVSVKYRGQVVAKKR